VYVTSALSPVASTPVCVFDHTNVLEPEPPVEDAVAAPVATPRHLKCVDAVILATSKSGCVIVTLAVDVAEQLSVTVTLYVPAANVVGFALADVYELGPVHE
jgi:hypothetical protein